MAPAKLRLLASLRSVGSGRTCGVEALVTGGPDEDWGREGGIAKKKLQGLLGDVPPVLLPPMAETSSACMHDCSVS